MNSNELNNSELNQNVSDNKKTDDSNNPPSVNSFCNQNTNPTSDTVNSLPYNLPNAAAKLQKKERMLIDLKTGDAVFACVLLLLCVLGTSFGIWGGFNIGFSVACAVFIVAISIYLSKKSATPGVYDCVCCGLALLCTTVFAVTSEESVRLFSAVAGFLLAAVWFGALGGIKKSPGDLGLIKDVFSSVFGNAFGNFFSTYKSVFVSSKKSGKNLVKVCLGIACAVPALCIILPLLIRSDAAFEGLIDNVFGDIITLVAQLLVGVFIAVFMIPYCLSLKNSKKEEKKPSSFKGIDNTFIISFLSVISLCYAVYLFSQLAYFFSAFSGFLPDGESYSYSGYARRGFFEMCIIAAINLVISFTVILVSKKNNNKLSVPLKVLCTFINAFTLVIIAASISKMVMYINIYGMTLLRVLTSSFMVFLAVVFIAVILRCYIIRINVLKVALVTGSCVLITLGLCNVKQVVAQYNYNAFINGSLTQLDFDTLFDMGDEGVPYIIKAIENKDKCPNGSFISCGNTMDTDYIVTPEMYLIFEYNKYYVMDETDSSFENTQFLHKRINLAEWRLSRERAYNALDEFSKNNPDFYKDNYKKYSSVLDYFYLY